MEIREDSPFFQLVLVIISILLDLFLDYIELVSPLVFILKNVAKVRLVLNFDVSFHILQFMGNPIYSNSFYLNIPPRRYLSFQSQVGDPYFLKMKKKCPFEG